MDAQTVRGHLADLEKVNQRACDGSAGSTELLVLERAVTALFQMVLEGAVVEDEDVAPPRADTPDPPPPESNPAG